MKALVDSIITPQSILFFDMDGTLIETTYLNNYAYRVAFETIMGYPMPELNTDRITRETIQSIPEITFDKFQSIVKEKDCIYLKNLYLAKPITHIATLLWDYSFHYKTYLITKCREERAIRTISYFGFRDRFTDIKSGSMGNKYEQVITQMGVNPKHIISLENEEKEILDGLKAGILRKNIIKVNNE